MYLNSPRARIVPRLLVTSSVALIVAALSAGVVSAQRRGGAAAAATPRTGKSTAPIDLTGYWVSIITEEWRWRMLTPPKNDFSSLPLTPEARKVADTWDLAKDEAAGLACKPYGIGNIMRMPGRLHITWQDDDTMKLEFDAGTQTRLLHFGGTPPTATEPGWQGYSAANWEVAGQPLDTDRNGIPVAAGRGAGGGGRAATPAKGGSLKVVTTKMREGYLRKNGIPYSSDAVVTEYFDRLGPEPNGDVILLVRTVVEDSKYLQQPFITSTHFKLEANGAKFSPNPCKIDPPILSAPPQ